MKPIKMFALAVLAALIAMAFAGTSSTMAESTTLCTSDGSGCGVTHVHETSVGKAKLLTTFLTVECDVLFLGDTYIWWVEAEGEEILFGETVSLSNSLPIVGHLTYTNCGSCTITEEKNNPTVRHALREGHETFKVTGESLVHVTCGASLDCSYDGVFLKGAGKGPLLSTQANGEVSIQKQTLHKETGGLLCPENAKLDITTTPLSATYISS